ncbi:MAG: S41 family peptidase [Chloroflexota bacterium]|nr:S41 family peptidase [Chloroflexota bacterium]
MWRILKWSLLGLVVALLVSLAGVTGYAVHDNSGSASSTSSGDNYAILNEVQSILQQDFVLPSAVKPDVLQKGAIDGVIAALNDPHSQYIPPVDYQNGVDLISGTFEGIGANVDQDQTSKEIIITAPFRGSPADKAGVLPGDVILKVDGTSTDGWTTADAVKKIRGPAGTPVTISVRHPDGTSADITIIRATVAVPTVFAQGVTDANGKTVPDLAYIQIQQFTDQTVPDMQAALQNVHDQGYKGLILDLRNNPGGGLDATVKVADLFLDGGIVLTQVDRDGNKTEYDAKSGVVTDVPVVVLVNKNSASGSEVLSGSLQDHGRAKLIGQQTFGKGSVNHLRQLSNGGALYVTIARWLTPNGTLIEGVGLTPDIKMDPTPADTEGKPGPELYTAIDLLHSEINGTTFTPPPTPVPGSPTPVATSSQ